MNHTQKIKVLVIRFSSIGDIVLCSPVMRCLKKITGKEIEVHLTTRQSFVSFTKNYPYIDKVISLDNDTGDLIRELKRENYDFVIDLHNNLRSLKVRNALARPFKAFKKLNIQKWLLTNFKINRMPDIHIVDRLMEAASPLGAENDGLGLDFFIPEAERVDLSSLPEELHNGYIAFVIGGTHFTKRLPAEKIITICNQLKKPVVLLGGPEDAPTGEYIASHTGNTFYNACGKYSLNGSASLAEQARVVISHDTGLMHIAAALGKPIASIWGNTVPELGMYPYYPKNFSAEQSRIFEIKDLYCRPCSKIGYKKCPKKHFRCMNEIPAQDVATWVNGFVQA